MRAKSSGGSTHIRYGHYYYPRFIELVCPKCDSRVISTNSSIPETLNLIIDISDCEKIWSSVCQKCT